MKKQLSNEVALFGVLVAVSLSATLNREAQQPVQTEPPVIVTSIPAPQPTSIPTPIPEPATLVVPEPTPVPPELATANLVWSMLQAAGYPDPVAAGILGNMMTECGGQTLNLQPYVYDETGKYYGLCQWSSTYHPDVQGADLMWQMEYLLATIEPVFNSMGPLDGYSYEHFVTMSEPADAAHAFAVVYERCSSSTYGLREDNAEVAYNTLAEE